MRAELVISHGPGNFVGELAAIFGPHDPNVLSGSAFAANAPSASLSIAYSAQGAQYSVLVWTVSSQAYVYLEATSGHLRVSADHAWSAILRGMPQLSPTVEQVRLFDEDANDVVAEAHTGLKAQASRPELRFTAWVSLATIVWLTIAVSAFNEDADIVLGAVPAVIGGLIALATLARGAHSQKLVWT